MKSNPTSGLVAAFVSLVYLVSVTAFAQEEEAGPETWGEDAKYVTVYYLQFKPGKREDGMEIISEYFVPAAEKAGLAPPQLAVHFQTGVWDAMYVWNLHGGMSDLEWYQSEDDVKWYAALAELNGGPEGAEKIMERWRDTVRESETQIGHYHSGADE